MNAEVRIEREWFEWVAQELETVAARLEAVHLRAQLLPIRIREVPDGRDSEVEVYFWRERDLVNAAAWMIYLKGRLVCDKEEWEKVVRRDLQEIIASERGTT